MASKAEKQRLLSGSLNLLPPSDKVPDGDALLLDNWRVDQAGELRSRKGSNLEAGQLGAGVFHTLTRAGNDRYAGIGTDLWWGPNLDTHIAGGFDSNPLGIAFYQSAAWVMNRNQQLRVKNRVGYNWGIAAPTTAPKASVGAIQVKTLQGWEGTGNPTASNAMDVGYRAAQGDQTYYRFPQTLVVVTQTGTVTVTNGSAAIVGSQTAWDQSMVGASIEVTTTINGVQWFGVFTIAAVQDTTHLTISSPWNNAANGLDGTGLIYGIFTIQAAASYDAANFQEGSSSLQVLVDLAATWTVTNNFSQAVDTTSGGTAQDDDVFAIWVYCTNPGAVDQISVTVFSGGYAQFRSLVRPHSTLPATAIPPFLPQPIQVATVTLPGSILNQTANSWTQVWMRRSLNVDALNQQISNASISSDTQTPDPQMLADLTAQLNNRLASPHLTAQVNGQVYTDLRQDGAGDYTVSTQTTSIDWTAINGVQVQMQLNGPTQFNLDYFYVSSVIGASLTGTGQYFVSYANADGEDSDLSPVSNTVTCQNQSIALNNVPISPDPQVTERWIWRSGFGSSQTLKVGTISDNAFGQFNDTTSTVQAQNIGVTAPTNRTLPPPARGVMGPFLGKLIAFNTDAHPCRYFWTNAGQPWFFPGSDDNDIGNWEDAGSDDDPLIMMTNHSRYALVYKQRSLGRLMGDPATADYEHVDGTTGLVGTQAVVNAGALGDFMVGVEGIYLRNADYKTKISIDIDPIFKGDYVLLTNGEYAPPIAWQWIGQSVLELCNDRLYFSYVEGGQSLPSVTLVCQLPGPTAITNVPAYRWTRMRLPNGGASAGGFTSLHYDGGPGNFLMGGVTQNWVSGVVHTGGYLYELETGTTDNGLPIHVAWQSRFSDQGLPDNFKRYSDLEIDFQTSNNPLPPSTLTVYLVIDNGVKITLGTISNSVRNTVSFSLQALSPYVSGTDVRGRNAAVRIEGDITSECIIFGTYLHWYPEERAASSFDSGFTNLGIPERVKQIDYLELYATPVSTGQTMNRMLSSDLPGSVLTSRDTTAVTLGPAFVRGSTRVRLPNIVEGRNFRLLLNSPARFQLHAIRLRQRVIGEYIDGTVGEFYESPEFSVSPGRDGELKDFILEYETATPGGQVVIYSDSDPPGTVLTVQRTLPLPAGGRRTYVFALEDANDLLPYGTLFKVRVIPPVGGIVRLHGRATFRARIFGVSFDGSAGEVWETQPLDLFGGIGLFREIVVVAQSSGAMRFQMFTELPGEDMRVVSSFAVNPLASTTGRLPVYARLPGTAKGQLQKFRLDGNFPVRLFEVKVLGRGLGTTETEWTWKTVPIETTPDEFQNIQMPVRQTPDEFTWIDLPVDEIS